MSSTTDKSEAIIQGGPGPLLDPPDVDTGVGDGTYPNAADEDRPLSDRLGRDPSNLGTDITDEGDVVHPTPDPGTPNL